ncbi:major core protein [Mono Lake orbivirus]|nr:major core protein [Mono Lake orbivirus]
MDAYNARALSVLEGLTLAADPRAHRDPVSETTLSIFIMRFNSTTTRPIMGTPMTREARRNNFYAAVDVVYAALGVTTQFPMPGYVQNPQTLAILARDEIPYTPTTLRRVQRIRICTEGASSVREERYPFTHYDMLVTAGSEIPVGAAGGPRAYIVSYNTMQVHVAAQQTLDVTDLITPNANDWVAMEFTWHIQADGPGANAIIAYARDLELYVDEDELEPGRPFRLTPNMRVDLTNRENLTLGTAIFVVHRYWVSAPPAVIYDSMEADILAVYTFRDDFWHRFRSDVCARVGLPATHYPLDPVTDPRQVLTIAMLSRLFDVYCALTPDVHIPALNVAPGGLAQRLRDALQALRGGR